MNARHVRTPSVDCHGMYRAAVDSLLASVTVPPGRKGVLCFLDEPPLLLTGSGAGFDPGAGQWWQSALEVAISA